MVITWNQLREQIKTGLELGCYKCRQEPNYLGRTLTEADMNPHCVKCGEFYCERHASKKDFHFCDTCLPNGASGSRR